MILVHPRLRGSLTARKKRDHADRCDDLHESELISHIGFSQKPPPQTTEIHIAYGCIICRKREGGTWWTDLNTREKWKASLNPSAAATDFTVASLSNRIREA